MEGTPHQYDAHLYTIIKVSRNEDLVEQIGKDVIFDLVDHDKVRSFRIQKKTPFNMFKKIVAKEFGVPVQFQRFWSWAKRQNHTYRPNRLLTVAEEAHSVGQLRVPRKANNGELKLFLEVELGPDTKPIAPPEKTEEDILLFFKLYDPLKEEMRFIGKLFVKGYGTPVEILTKLNEMAGFWPEEPIDLFEEIKFEPCVMCEHIDLEITFRASQLEDGDIICFQKSQSGSEQCRYPDVPSFLEYVRNYQTSNILLPKLPALKNLKVAFRHATKDEVVIHTVRLPKQSTIGDVINDLKSKVELSNPDAEVRLLEVFYHKIYKIFPLNEKIENINDHYWTLRAEEIPEEEKNFGPQDRLIHVYHFMKDTSQNQVQVKNFGEPFLLVIHKDETLAEVKVRIQKKLQIPDEEYAKWKFAFLSLGRPEYLKDSDTVASRFQERDFYGAWEQYLGLEHTNKDLKVSYIANQGKNSSPFAEFDTLFNKIKNLLEENTSDPNNSNNFCAKEIANAERVFEQCLDTDIASVIQSGKAPEFMKSLSILLITRKSLPINAVERTTGILANFIQSCERYESARLDLSEARENEISVSELKVSLKQLLADFTPVRNQAEAVDQEIARLEKQIASRKAQKELLITKLEDLATHATTSKEALVCAEEKMKLFAPRKEQAEKVIEDVEQSWEFLKDLRTLGG